MKITFNLLKTGLGNNGGSSTIVNSANILTNLGNEVTIIDSGKNEHTWIKLKAKHLRINDFSQCPDGDIIIATGFNSVKSTLKLPKRCGIKSHWIRGWELWKLNEYQIIQNILNVSTIKFVNSLNLKDKLNQYNIDSYIVRPGYDIENYIPLNIRDKKIIIGGLYNTRHNTKRTSWIFNSIKLLKQKYDIELWMFGTDKFNNNGIVDKYFRSPTIEEKNKIYNYIHICLAPTESEGLHMPPAEAMLTGCICIGTNALMNGMREYLIDYKTGLISKNNINSFTEKIEEIIIDKKLRNNLSNNCREQIIKLGNRKENMKKFTDLIKKLREFK